MSTHTEGTARPRSRAIRLDNDVLAGLRAYCAPRHMPVCRYASAVLRSHLESVEPAPAAGKARPTSTRKGRP